GAGHIAAGGDGDSLHGPASSTTWQVHGPGSGAVAGLAFEGMESLFGAPDNEDTFVFGALGGLAGVVDGGAGGFDSVVLDGGSFASVKYTFTGRFSGVVTRDGVELAYDGMEPLTDNSSAAARVFEGTVIADRVELIRTGPGTLRIQGENDLSGFERHDFADPSISLTVDLGFNAKGTDEHIFVGALGAVAFDLILDTGSTNKNDDGEDTVRFDGDISLGGHDLVVTAETITVSAGVVLSTSDGTQAGDITFDSWDVALESGSQLLAVGPGIDTSGDIEIDARDVNAYFTPLVNVDVSEVSVTVAGGVVISGRDVVIVATADNEHIVDLSDGELSSIALDTLAQAVEGLTQVVAGVSVSVATATIDLQAGSTINARNFVASAEAKAFAVTEPILPLPVGAAVAVDVTDATLTLAGNVTTTGNATLQASTDNAIRVLADTSGLKGAAAALAVSVIVSNAQAHVTDDAVLVVGGNLSLQAVTTDRTRTISRSAAGKDGSV
ncbi:MAG: hypothetical protein ACRDPR_17605, partial [Nocardioidaceae bacterium]